MKTDTSYTVTESRTVVATFEDPDTATTVAAQLARKNHGKTYRVAITERTKTKVRNIEIATFTVL